MFDSRLQAWLAPTFTRLAKGAHRLGLTPNQVTVLAFALGIACALSIALQQHSLALGLLLVSRLLDGLDGALARLTAPTDAGGYLDITLDFLFYASVPLAFALQNPSTNTLPACVLLFTFIGTASSFLAYASIAAKRQQPSQKSLSFLGGLTEGFETLLCFALMCLFPTHFYALAYGFSGLCALTTIYRLHAGWRDFSAIQVTLKSDR